MNQSKKQRLEDVLLHGVQGHKSELESMLRLMSEHWTYEDPVYRFYHQSFKFDFSHNQNWEQHTRPLLEAFFHSKFMIEMAVRYADLEKPPQALPSGWAALLYLFNLR